MRSFFVAITLLCGSLSVFAPSMAVASEPEIHSNEELIAIVLTSPDFKVVRPQVRGLELQKIVVESGENDLAPKTIYFEYGSGNPAKCEARAVIPIHFNAPTSINVNCNDASVDPGFGRSLKGDPSVDPGFGMKYNGPAVDPGFARPQ